ncbi:hypothetical protein KCP70_02105 [Salmonella enterica subsp. enterica]|nr:hypothetical protein KCP70_02105 [Salmonella enterica subsp. enterica]
MGSGVTTDATACAAVPVVTRASADFCKYIPDQSTAAIGWPRDMSVYIARTILNDWPQILLLQVTAASDVLNLRIISHGGGRTGRWVAGRLLTFMFKSKTRWMTGLIFALALCICIVLVPLVQDTSTISPHLCHHHVSALYGPHMLLAVGLPDVTHKDAR